MLSVARVRVDREDDVTAIGLPQSAPPTLGELVAELREWITEDDREVEDGEPTPDNPNPRPVSLIIEQFDAQVLAPLRADLDGITTPGGFRPAARGPARAARGGSGRSGPVRGSRRLVRASWRRWSAN